MVFWRVPVLLAVWEEEAPWGSAEPDEVLGSGALG